MLVLGLLLAFTGLVCLVGAVLFDSVTAAWVCVVIAVVGVIVLIADVAWQGRIRGAENLKDAATPRLPDLSPPADRAPPKAVSYASPTNLTVKPARSARARGPGIANRLAAIATGAVLRQAWLGRTPTTEDWADIAKDVVTAMAEEAGNTSYRRRSSDKAFHNWSHAYERHMIAGQRFLSDLPDGGQFATHRDGLIQQALGEFVRASATAQQALYTHGVVEAEAAIAGCWLWVPSSELVKRNLVRALDLVGEIRKLDSAKEEADIAFVTLVELSLKFKAIDTTRDHARKSRAIRTERSLD